MSPLNAQDTGDRVSIWTVILSSSVIVAVITGLSYFMGGAYYQGYSQTLGLRYLAGSQPAEYMFTGGQLLMVFSSAFWFLVAVLMVPAIQLLLTSKWRYPYRWEPGIYILLIFSSALFFFFLSPTPGMPRDLIRNGACPITDNDSLTRAERVLGGMIAITVIFSLPFLRRLLRFTFRVWGLVLVFLCLYNFARFAGANQSYQPFQVANIVSPSLSAAETKVLILGADDKNLVVLVPGENTTGHPEPRYLLRSEIKTFRIVGNSSINDFFCKQMPGK